LTDAQAGDLIRFKDSNGKTYIGRVSSIGTTYIKPFYTKGDLIYYVKVFGFDGDFIVSPKAITEVLVVPVKVQFD
jgi:hypothetical protein